MPRSVFFMLTALMMLVLSAAVSAQESNPLAPIYLYDGSVFWRWTEADGLQQITESLPATHTPTLSPDRQWVAYHEITPRTQAYIDEFCPCGGGAFATDLWLLNIETGERTQITFQPEDAESVSDEIARSGPLWSPDSSAFAWVDGVEVGDLMIYDLASGETRLVAEGLRQTGLASNVVAILNWTEAGIYKLHDIYGDGLEPIGYEIHFYDPDTGALTVVPISLAEWSMTSYLSQGTGEFASINEGGAILSPKDGDQTWSLTTLANGREQVVTGAVVKDYAANAPETSLRVLPPYISEDGSYHYVVENANSEQVMVVNNIPLISPDGNALLTGWYEDMLTIHRPDQPELIINLPWVPFVAYWGQKDSEIQPRGDTVISSGTCEGGRLQTRLRVNGTAWVVGASRNNVRAEPGSDAELIGQIAAGDWFTVKDGPVCADGIAWWYAESASSVGGWTAEGQGNEYFLQLGCPPEGCARG